MDKYFKQAEDLDGNINDYFKPAGDLNSETKEYFKMDGNLDTNEVKGSTTSDFIINYLTKDDIDRYLDEIVSGKNMNNSSDFGMAIGSGSMIVSFEQLRNMVEDENYNYNIVKAECYNPKMIAVVYEKFERNKVRKF